MTTVAQSIGIGIEGVDGENLVPYGPDQTRFIALDDKVYDISLDYDVRKGETLTVRFANNRSVGEDDDPEDLVAFPSAILIVTEEV